MYIVREPLLTYARCVLMCRTAAGLMGPYCASKFGMEAITDAMRLELQQFGISVSAIEPGTRAYSSHARSKPSWRQWLSECLCCVCVLQALSERRWCKVSLRTGKRNGASSRPRYARSSSSSSSATHNSMAALLTTQWHGHPQAKQLYKLQDVSGQSGMQMVFRNAPSPIIVAEKIAHALTSEYPKTRYLVGTDAIAYAAVAYLPDRMRDALLEMLSKLAGSR